MSAGSVIGTFAVAVCRNTSTSPKNSSCFILPRLTSASPIVAVSGLTSSKLNLSRYRKYPSCTFHFSATAPFAIPVGSIVNAISGSSISSSSVVSRSRLPNVEEELEVELLLPEFNTGELMSALELMFSTRLAELSSIGESNCVFAGLLPGLLLRLLPITELSMSPVCATALTVMILL